MVIPPKGSNAPQNEIRWLGSPEHPDSATVAAATRLEFDQVSGHAAIRSPVFLGNVNDTTISATLLFDSHLGYLLAVDSMGLRVGRFSRWVDSMDVSRPVLWREHHEMAGVDAETLFCAVSKSLLLRHRDIGLPIRLQGATDEFAFGLPVHLVEGFLSRADRGLPSNRARGPMEH